MEFREYLEMREGRLGRGLKKGLAAGLLGASMLSPSYGGQVLQDDLSTFMVMDAQKDQNAYYTPQTYQKLAGMAYDGDEWAIREIAWPKGHKFHKFGRPFFKNHEPHPDGLVPNSGYGRPIVISRPSAWPLR